MQKLLLVLLLSKLKLVLVLPAILLFKLTLTQKLLPVELLTQLYKLTLMQKQLHVALQIQLYRPISMQKLPLVKPLELAQLAVLALLFSRWRAMSDDANRRLLGQAGLAAGFVMLSIGTLRGVHHLANLPWDPSLLGSSTAQTSLTVAWSVVGVLALVAGSRRASRPTWLVGSLIMGVVLAKLLLVDRTYIGNLQGIISFIVVGLLFTTVGYFAPTPPREVPAGSAA